MTRLSLRLRSTMGNSRGNSRNRLGGRIDLNFLWLCVASTPCRSTARIAEGSTRTLEPGGHDNESIGGKYDDPRTG